MMKKYCTFCKKETKRTEDGYCVFATQHHHDSADWTEDSNPIFKIGDYVLRKKINHFIHVWGGDIVEILPNNKAKVEWGHYLHNGSVFSIISFKNIFKKIKIPEK